MKSSGFNIGQHNYTNATKLFLGTYSVLKYLKQPEWWSLWAGFHRLMLMELQTSQADHLSASLVNAETLWCPARSIISQLQWSLLTANKLHVFVPIVALWYTNIQKSRNLQCHTLLELATMAVPVLSEVKPQSQVLFVGCCLATNINNVKWNEWMW